MEKEKSIVEEAFCSNVRLGERFSPKELKEDIDYLFNTLEEVHPNPFAYTQRSIIMNKKKKIKQNITNAMKPLQFYHKVGPLVSKLGDPHTHILWNQFWKAYEGERNLVFPISIEFKGKKAFITRNFSQYSIPSGSEVLSVNGISISQIKKKIEPFLIAGRKRREKMVGKRRQKI